jgi:hypothetical protein
MHEAQQQLTNEAQAKKARLCCSNAPFVEATLAAAKLNKARQASVTVGDDIVGLKAAQIGARGC